MPRKTVDYSSITDPKAKQAAAIQDIKDYLGRPRFKAICKIVHETQKMTRQGFIFQLELLVGIEGYPAEAWCNELGLVDPVKTEVSSTETVSL